MNPLIWGMENSQAHGIKNRIAVARNQGRMGMELKGVAYHWKRLWCWEGLEAGGEGDDRGWDGWMASLTWCTWVWVHSGSWWWTGRPGVLQFMGSQRIGHDWVTELNWINRYCEMKLSTAKSVNKKCHSHQRFLASKCECGLPKLNPSDAATRHGDYWGPGGTQGAAIGHSCHYLRWPRKQDLAQIAEVHMKAMNSVSPEAWIFPYIQC